MMQRIRICHPRPADLSDVFMECLQERFVVEMVDPEADSVGASSADTLAVHVLDSHSSDTAWTVAARAPGVLVLLGLPSGSLPPGATAASIGILAPDTETACAVLQCYPEAAVRIATPSDDAAFAAALADLITDASTGNLLVEAVVGRELQAVAGDLVDERLAGAVIRGL